MIVQEISAARYRATQSNKFLNRMNCMQTLIIESPAAYSPAGISGLFFSPELMRAATIAHELTSRTPADFLSESLGSEISAFPRQDDDDIEDEDDEDEDLDEDEDEDEDDLDDEEDDDLEDEDDDDLEEDEEDEEEDA
jgi:hypothetical protein